jgi:hypothetical protein
MSKPVPPVSSRDLDARLRQLAAEMQVSTLDLLRGAGRLAGSSCTGPLRSFLSLIAHTCTVDEARSVQVPLQPDRADDDLRLVVDATKAEVLHRNAPLVER